MESSMARLDFKVAVFLNPYTLSDVLTNSFPNHMVQMVQPL